MSTLVAKTQARITGTHDCWCVDPGEDEAALVAVDLEIEGDCKSGYQLFMAPEGFFVADNWYQTREEAFEDAQELFGVEPDVWSTRQCDELS